MSELTKRFPKQHIIGFAASIILTVAAAWAAVSSDLPTPWVITSIMVLAVIQAGIQLFMFMHMTESDGIIQTGNMLHGFFIAAVIVAGSIWTMSFGFTHDHDDGGNSGNNTETEQHEHMGH
ncbi:cytochrome aa3 quinol oxidase subunit IV [Alteribacillus bidgolensis]|uniref:Quinol oxidase subunit 4 n=1 Tax=Alteribacillus bidgolensis TaxID=930129 RepID=A0A1G8II17_9BACI|nr:cytochrome aa3 quinol oxidase subunit IV [Alteribacillus bidgolensis]SDI18170.1 cytochrome aa3 quinol oxidase subunit 4 [Alteribacillus bidgolensis]